MVISDKDSHYTLNLMIEYLIGPLTYTGMFLPLVLCCLISTCNLSALYEII